MSPSKLARNRHLDTRDPTFRWGAPNIERSTAHGWTGSNQVDASSAPQVPGGAADDIRRTTTAAAARNALSTGVSIIAGQRIAGALIGAGAARGLPLTAPSAS